ncbi:MAG: SDR family NAD(P)-dependent oxidoreductase [Bdellovibrionales bacterium]
MTESSLFVSGASSAIGIELIKRNSLAYSTIYAHYNSNGDALLRLKSELSAKLVPIQGDLGSPDGVDKLCMNLAAVQGPPLSFVHLAAPRLNYSQFKSLRDEDFDREWQVQVKSFVSMLNVLLPAMLREKFGRTVLLLSNVVHSSTGPYLSSYSAAKHALWGLTKSLASEYGPKNVFFNGVSPSMMATPFLEKVNEKIVELAAHQHPMGRLGRVTDVVPMVELLLNPKTEYINGVAVPINGGAPL